jgi:hypothetical protein
MGSLKKKKKKGNTTTTLMTTTATTTTPTTTTTTSRAAYLALLLKNWWGTTRKVGRPITAGHWASSVSKEAKKHSHDMDESGKTGCNHYSIFTSYASLHFPAATVRFAMFRTRSYD